MVVVTPHTHIADSYSHCPLCEYNRGVQDVLQGHICQYHEKLAQRSHAAARLSLHVLGVVQRVQVKNAQRVLRRDKQRQ